MKKTIIRTLLLFSLGVLTIFTAATLIAADSINKTAARDNAVNLLGILESRMKAERCGAPGSALSYQALALYTDGINDIRITIIAAEDGAGVSKGEVLGDTDFNNPVVLENHSGRKEFLEALNGGTGEEIRNSASLKTELLYVARLVSAEGAPPVVLRVAVPVKSVNSYFYSTLLITAIIFVLVMAVTVPVSGYAANRLSRPFVLIKNKLSDVLSPDKEAKPIILTKYDDINAALQDIDEISGKLNSALEENRAEKHKLDLILNNIDQGIIALGPDKRVVSCNKTAEDYFGFEFTAQLSAAQVIRNKTLLENIDGAAAKNEFVAFDLPRKNGEIFEVRIFPIDAKEISLIITAQNVTDVRKISREKQEFFANAGHELNTPLSSVIGYSEMLLADKKYNGAFTETINREALRMKLLIEDMLKISELEGNKEIRDENINVKTPVGQAVLAAAPKAKNKNIALTADLDDCTVFANAEKITEVAANLIDNAIKYTAAGGAVSVSLKAQGGTAVLSVKDNGIGIPEKALSRVFERFYRVNKGRSGAEGGTGLGLAIVKHICNRYNAPVKIRSKEGAGTEISVIFTRVP